MNKIILAAEAKEINDTEVLKEVTSWIDQEFELMSISSIYELSEFDVSRRSTKSVKLAAAKSISVAYSVQSELEPIGFLKRLQTKQKAINERLAHGGIYLYLLFFSDNVFMLPNINLPNPEWLERPDWILASAELWPKFEHPILEESLEIIARNRKIKVADYFFAQGKELLQSPTAGN
ncbi:MAG: hypothetical protein VX642_13360 [Bdellovibrionota bacterium]|nr:hypothetical protein [Bdellovibrionota bacterium]